MAWWEFVWFLNRRFPKDGVIARLGGGNRRGWVIKKRGILGREGVRRKLYGLASSTSSINLPMCH